MANTNEISKEKLLLVEGKDEYNFFDEYLKYHNIIDIQIIEVGGKDKFRVELPTLIASPNFNTVKSYAIIRDADDSFDSTLQSINDTLTRNHQPTPNDHNTFKDNGTIKVGIYIMPGSRSTGMLENLILDSLEAHPIKTCVDDYIACLETSCCSSETIKPPRNKPKAKMLAFLAGFEESCYSIGIAAKKKYFDFGSDSFSELKIFLESL